MKYTIRLFLLGYNSTEPSVGKMRFLRTYFLCELEANDLLRTVTRACVYGMDAKLRGECDDYHVVVGQA